MWTVIDHKYNSWKQYFGFSRTNDLRKLENTEQFVSSVEKFRNCSLFYEYNIMLFYPCTFIAFLEVFRFKNCIQCLFVFTRTRFYMKIANSILNELNFFLTHLLTSRIWLSFFFKTIFFPLTLATWPFSSKWLFIILFSV